MSYWDIALMNNDSDLRARVTACSAQEVPEGTGPESWAAEHMLVICASPGWSDAWASALAAGNATPGRDPAVITDGQILSAVQATLAAG